MTRRTTVTAEADDLALLADEARRRRVSLATVLREAIAEKAAEVRRTRPRPRFGIVRSGHGGLADLSWQDEDAPFRDEPLET